MDWIDAALTPEALKIIAIVAAGLFCGGLAKGVLGLGMPGVAVPVMLFALDAPSAVAMLLVPSFGANIVQLSAAPQRAALFKRFAGLIVALCIGAACGAMLLTGVDNRIAIFALGVVSIGFAASQALKWRPEFPAHQEGAYSAGVGLIAGVFGGFTGLFGPPVAAYLMALRLNHEAFIGAVSMIYLAGMSVLLIFLWQARVATPALLAASALGWIAVCAGMRVGTILRQRMNERVLRTLLLIFLFSVGVQLIVRALSAPA